MKKIQITIIFFLSIVFTVSAQYDCKVLIEELQGQYNGDCKKGLAHGEGAAKGIDTYIGNFKKGLPNGYGVYSYANGSSYIGNFSKGKKDGYGLLNRINNEGARQQDYGLWLADSLVVSNVTKALFKVQDRKGIKVIDPDVDRNESVKSQIWINFQVDGVPDKSVVISKAEVSSGRLMDTEKRSLNTYIAFDEIEEFPVTFKLEYKIRKITHFEMTECVAEVTLFTKGRWEIDINH